MTNATETNNRVDRDVFKGLVTGLIGGLVASWTMNRFQDVWVKLSEKGDRSASGRSTEQSEGEEQDDTTVKAASANIRRYLPPQAEQR